MSFSGTSNEAFSIIAEALEQFRSIDTSGVFEDQPDFENYQGEVFGERQEYIDQLTGCMFDALEYVETRLREFEDTAPF